MMWALPTSNSMKKVINILPNKKEYCLLIKAAFDTDFCDKIIEEKKESFKKAKTHYPTSYRNNERQLLESKNLSTQLFQEVKNYIPQEIKIEGISKQECGNWKLDGINERIRICRYLPNQYFNKHLDGVHFDSAIRQSKLTFMIYLNGSEDFEGGRTLFFNSKEDETIIGNYVPEKGDLMIFDHNLWHSGEMVLRGEKYILRSDIVYQKIDGINKVDDCFCSEGHLGYIWTATVLNDRLVTSGRDKKIKIWSLEGNKVGELTGHANSIISLIAFDERTLISASRDMSIKVWKKGEEDFQLEKTLNYHEGAVLCLCKMSDSAFLSGGADGVLNQIAKDGTLSRKFQAHDEWIWGIARIDATYFTTISEDGSLKVWDNITSQEIAVWKEDIPINSIVVAEDIILLGRLNGTIVKLRFNRINQSLTELDRKACHNGIIRRLAIDKAFLYSAGEDNVLKIWDKEHFELITTHKHKNFVQDIALLDNAVITVSYDGEIIKNKKPN